MTYKESNESRIARALIKSWRENAARLRVGYGLMANLEREETLDECANDLAAALGLSVCNCTIQNGPNANQHDMECPAYGEEK